jgi:hypothetical protein
MPVWTFDDYTSDGLAPWRKIAAEGTSQEEAEDTIKKHLSSSVGKLINAQLASHPLPDGYVVAIYELKPDNIRSFEKH